MSRIAVVVPTIRQESLKRFINAWAKELQQSDISVIVVEDAAEKGVDVPSSWQHYSHAEIRKDLGADSWIISRKDSAVRAYGFIKAWEQGADVVVTLDDDVSPDSTDVVMTHHSICNSVTAVEKWQATTDAHTRGTPYQNTAKEQPVVISHGLWKGVPDLDAMHQLVERKAERKLLTQFIAGDTYYPMCGMNLGFSRKILPAMYFPLMGFGEPYARFDDIWAGVMSKKICDYLGYSVWSGYPFVRHERASDPMMNLIKEAPGVPVNETFWAYVDSAPLTAATVEGAYAELAEHLQRHPDSSYFRRLGEAMLVWLSILEERNPTKE